MVLLNDMALFVEVVKALSFRGAAKTIGMPNSTLSRRISVLEKAIGLRLLHRTTRHIELTEPDDSISSAASAALKKPGSRTSNSARCWPSRAASCAPRCQWTSRIFTWRG